MEKYGFVYLWFDKKHKRYYVGSHWGTEDDGYICSSRWMRKAYRRRPNDFKRRIIGKCSDRKGAFLLEDKYLTLIKPEELGNRYYNLSNKIKGHWTLEESSRLTISQKISIKNKGNTHKKKREYSEEGLRKMRESNAKQRASVIEKNGGNGFFSGRQHTDEAKEKMKQAKAKFYEAGGLNHFTGKTHSSETIEKIKEKNIGRICLFNSVSNTEIRVYPEDLEKYIKQGFVIGQKKRNRKPQSEETKRKISEAQKGQITIHDPNTLKKRKVHPNKVDEFLSMGYILGIPNIT